jgi:DNA ligase-1
MVSSIIKQLRETNSKKKKEEILKKYKDIELLKTVFMMTYSNDVNFWSSSIVKSKEYDPQCKDLDEVLVESYKVINRELTGHAARDYLTQLHSQLCKPEDQEIFERIVSKDLRCGVNETTLLKIWPDLIFVPPYMRCSSFSIKAFSKIKYPCISQTKADGMYCNVVISNSVKLISRNGKILKFDLPDTTKDKLVEYANHKVLMGEALAVDDSGKVMSREDSNGYLNSKNVDPSRVVIYVWDCVTHSEFISQKSDVPYGQRFATSEQIVYKLKYSDNITSFDTINTVICNSFDECVDHFKEMLDSGQEGTVVKNINGVWKNGTSSDQIKLKIEFECELKVVGMVEGTGKNKGKLGALACESEDGILKVNVGIGFSDEQREQEYEEGSIITAKSNAVLEKGTPCLFLPRFIEVRTDKTEADTFKRIKEQQQAYIDAIKLTMKQV